MFVVAIIAGALGAVVVLAAVVLYIDAALDVPANRAIYRAQKREFDELTKAGWENRPHWTTTVARYDDPIHGAK